MCQCLLPSPFECCVLLIQYDVVSDINLTTEIFTAINNRECDDPDLYCAADGSHDGTADEADRESAIDTAQEWALLACGIMSLVFLLLPYALNIGYASKVPNNVIITANQSARVWFEQYQSMFISLVGFSGGCYPALSLVSSNLFGIKLLNSGLSTFELEALSEIRVISTVFSENMPQLLVQILYCYSIGTVTQNTYLAACTSVASIAGSLLNYCINKDTEGQAQDVFFYWRVKLKKKGATLTKKQRKAVKQRWNVKRKLARAICKGAYSGDVDITNFEIGYVHLRNDSFVIRVIHHVHEQVVIEKNKYAIDEKALEDLSGKKLQAAVLKPFKAYCKQVLRPF